MQGFHVFAPLLAVGVNLLRQVLKFGNYVLANIVNALLDACNLSGGTLDLGNAVGGRYIGNECAGLCLNDIVEAVEVGAILEEV